MLDHIMIDVSDYEKSRIFFEKALEPLNYKVVMEFGRACGFGVNNKPYLWIREGKKGQPVHIAFNSPNRKLVDEFYSFAMENGGVDNGKPGLRLHYHENYYGAFVFDPDGNNIEAVCHLAETSD